MKLVMSPQAIAVVRLPVGVPDPEWARGGPLVSVTRTATETSVIVPTSSVPEDVPGPVQGPLVGVYVDELLDFSQVGILVSLLKPLADAGIPVLTVSTYDTDWVLLEASRAAAATSVWRAAGYQVIDAAREEVPTGVVDLRDGARADGADGAGGADGIRRNE
ncbi:MAG: uncharacterized protein QG622_2999 [Actinomycetota bacterium]|nr:uncharacterized protein [Actinomycetota bacterium]